MQSARRKAVKPRTARFDMGKTGAATSASRCRAPKIRPCPALTLGQFRGPAGLTSGRISMAFERNSPSLPADGGTPAAILWLARLRRAPIRLLLSSAAWFCGTGKLERQFDAVPAQLAK